MPAAKRDRNGKPWMYIHDRNNEGWQKLDGSWLETKWGRDFLMLLSKGAQKPTHPPLQLILDSFPGVKVAEGGFKRPPLI